MTATKPQKQTLPNLPYAYDALEPYISAEIMEIHHKKHHNAYVNNFNALLDKSEAALDAGDHAGYLALQQGLKFNGGGALNHSIFWTVLAPKSEGGGELSSGALADEIFTRWGSPEEFWQAFTAKAMGVQGSGWCWLGYDKAARELVITTTANQDPLSAQGLIPLFGVDVWEHAYYLQYKNDRGAYIKNIWEVINWRHVAERYSTATS